MVADVQTHISPTKRRMPKWDRAVGSLHDTLQYGVRVSTVYPQNARQGSRVDRGGWSGSAVRDTLITIWGLVAHRRLGLSDAEIVQAVQGLTPADLEAAWEYAAANGAEIDEAIRANEEGEEGFVE